MKKAVWNNILQLIIPYRKQFFWVVLLSLLGTGANLVEPLIYREAINDVAGLFVKQANDAALKEEGLPVEDEVLPFPDQIRKTTLAQKDSQLRKKNHIEPIGKLRKKKIKEPHSMGHVAPRSPEQALDTLLWAVVLLFFINLIANILWRIGENKNVKLSCLIEQRFIQSTFAHVLSLPLSFFSRRSSAAISKQIDQSEEVSGIVNGFSQQILPEAISLLGIIAIMFYENLALTSIAMIIIPFYIIIAWRSAKRLESGLSKYYERWEQVSTKIQDDLSGIKTVKLSGAELREGESLRQTSDEAYKDYVRRSRLANKYVFWETMLTHLSTALVLGYGGWLTLQNKLTPGDVVMFVTYLDRLYGPIDSLASLWVSLQQNIASITRAFKLLEHGQEPRSGRQLLIQKGRIDFMDVRFAYGTGKEVLKGVSFSCQPGQMTALVGVSGAGKTTAVDLLMKLYEPTAGKILIDNQDLADLDADSVRSQVGMVSADGAIFSGSLADNIRFKRPDASDEEVKKAAIAAGMEGTMERLTDGLQTKVGENGIGLSVGERQRVQIARILVAHPRILVLDEATANLDYATEAEVKKTIEEIRKENTVVIIAHRYSMVRDADHVIVLQDGKIMEEGSPHELLSKGGWFTGFSNAAENKDIELEDDLETAEEEDFPDE
jgi:ABC-type multidrug transport system fused ATPase/permease subunit